MIESQGFDCPDGPDVEAELPDPNGSCLTYSWICGHGEPFKKECRFGLYFNPELHLCALPANVPGCDSGEFLVE